MFTTENELCVYQIRSDTPLVFLPKHVDPEAVKRAFKYQACPCGLCSVGETIEICQYPHPSACSKNRRSDFCDRSWAAEYHPSTNI